MNTEDTNGKDPLKDAESPGPIDAGGSEQTGMPIPSAAFSVLHALVGDRIPKGPLGPETVPTTMLAIPVSIMTEDLVQHRKHCQAPSCRHLPPPLQVFRHMRPESIRTAKDLIHKVLWTHPSHERITWTRKEILKRYLALANEVSSGRLFIGGRLGEILSELGQSGPRIVAAMLWATEFKSDGAEAMFRMLVPLVEEGVPRRPTTDGISIPMDDRNRPLKERLKNMFREREDAKRTAAQGARELQQKEQALGKLRHELQEASDTRDRLAGQLETLQEKLQERIAQVRILQNDAEKGTKINATLRRDLSDARQSLDAIEMARSDLVRELAAERHHVKQLELNLAATPTGSRAVLAFLREEEERIEMDRMTKQGGDRTHAEEERKRQNNLEAAFLAAYPEHRQRPRAKIRPRSSLRLHALGGSDEIGRSCYLIELGNRRILVDCGIKPDSGEDLHPAIEAIERPDAVILTHAHTDHVGWVPALVRRFPDIDIYCSDGTAALLPVMLEDCHQHYSRWLAIERERTQYIKNAQPPEEYYDLGDVNRTCRIVFGCSFDVDVALPFAGTRLRFYKAGHVLGASSVLIEDKSGRRLFLSGDFSSFDQLTVGAAEWPDELGEVDLLILESTYGSGTHKPIEENRRALISYVRATLEGGGSVILAAFALGRAQELLSLLASARATNQLPDTRIYVDGMIKRINPIYRELASFSPPADAWYEVGGEYDRQEVALAAQKTPSIIVTTSGMLSGGPVIHYAQQLLRDPRHRLVLTGYQDVGAPSRALLEVTSTGRRLVEVEGERGEKITIEAAVPAKVFGLSAHADQPGLIKYAGRLRPKNIALVHGETEGQRELRRCLLKAHPEANIVCGPIDLPVS